jgi:hypothetical protein
MLTGSIGIASVIGLGAASALSPNQTTDINAATMFKTATSNDNHTFRVKVEALEANAIANLSSSSNKDAVKTFGNQYMAAKETFHTTKANAVNTFITQITNGDNVATSENQLINTFNMDASNYLNSIQVAKNQLANTLGNKSPNANSVKTIFVNGLNTDESNLGNSFQTAKNDFTNTVV